MPQCGDDDDEIEAMPAATGARAVAHRCDSDSFLIAIDKHSSHRITNNLDADVADPRKVNTRVLHHTACCKLSIERRLLSLTTRNREGRGVGLVTTQWD
jgi:hypothetical protein